MNRRDSGVIRHRHTSRFDKPTHTVTGYPLAYSMRRPIPFPRRRILTNHFPSQSFRPFLTSPTRFAPLIRPGENIMYQGPRNFFRPFPPQNSDQFLFHNSPQSNSENFNPNTFPRAQAPAHFENGYHKVSNSATSVTGVSNTITGDELWIETLAPDGRAYYYNASSRVTCWEKPENVRIMSFHQLQFLASNPPLQQDVLQNTEKCFTPVNPQSCLQNAPPINNFMSLPPPGIVYPPTLCTPPPFLSSPAPVLDCPQIHRDYKTPFENINFSGPVAANFPETGISDVHNDRQCDKYLDSDFKIDEVNMQQATGPGEHFKCTEKKDSRKKKSSDKPSTEESEQCNDTEIRRQIAKDLLISVDTKNTDFLDQGDTKSVDVDSKDKIREDSADIEKSLLFEVQPLEEHKDNKAVDKSRPISSTPVSGTKWCVVWTGENKVFFYDAGRKISVWEIPNELKNRSDVQKLTQLPPVISETKEVSSNVSPSGAKKIKIDGAEDSIPDIEIVKNNANGKENVDEIVLKASREREQIPHETRIQMFLQMLAEKKVSAFSTWEKELHKIVFDSRYLLLAPKERKQKFELYVRNKIEEEKLNRKMEAQAIKENFKSLLQEARVTHSTRFSDFAHKFGKDTRFKAVEKIKLREKLFDEYIRNVSKSDERQREKFMDLLKKQSYLTSQSSWEDVKSRIANSEAYINLKNEEVKESLFEHYIQNFLLSGSTSKGKEDRINASIQIRHEEVRRDLSGSLREMQKERELHKQEAMRNGYDALLIDLVRNPDITFREAMKLLKDDHRWTTVRDLNLDDREYLFDSHVSRLISKKREQFRQILRDIKEITLTSAWRDVRRTVRNDPRCVKFSTEEKKCEKEFKEYMRDRLKEAKEDFKDLMKETKIITHASKDLMKSSNHLDAIVKVLSNDKRYLVLESFHRERKEMLLSYIDKLHRWGPPTPTDLLTRKSD